MTEQATSPRSASRPRPKRGEGQWALGYNEPLNANEQSKKDDNPLNVEARIRTIYSRRGFDSIDPADLRGRFRWMGLYTQRAPGFDGGKTATLEPHELDDRFFMMRVRSDGELLGAGAAAHARRDLDRLRPRHRRHHRPAEHPVPLDPDRGRARDLVAARHGRPEHPGGLRRLPPRLPRLAGRRRRQGRDHRRHPGAGRDQAALHRQAGVRQPAAQVQDLRLRSPVARRRPRDQRRLLRRHRPPRARSRLRRLGRRRPVDQPDAGPEAGRLDLAARTSPTCGRGSSRSSATTATAGCARAPA